MTNTAEPAPNWRFLGWVYPSDFNNVSFLTNNPYRYFLYVAKTNVAVFGLPLSAALTMPGLIWTSFGSPGWYGQTNVTRGGLPVAGTLLAGDAQEAWLQTTVSGPSTLSFGWRNDGSTNNDSLSLAVDGAADPEPLKARSDWTTRSVFLAAGDHVVRWQFRRATRDDLLVGHAYLAGVQVTPGRTAPVVSTRPANQTLFQGEDLTVNASFGGTPPLLFELRRGGVSVTAPSPTFPVTFRSVQLSDAGSYLIRASNAAGFADSAPFEVIVIPTPPANARFAARSNFPLAGVQAAYNVGTPSETGAPSLGYGRIVWWSWTAPDSGRYRLSLSADSARPVRAYLGIYAGSVLSQLQSLNSSSESSILVQGVYQLRADVVFNAVRGSAYALAVDSDYEPLRSFNLSLATDATLPNDAFAQQALLIGVFASAAGDNRGATLEPGEPSSSYGKSLWYEWTAPQTGLAWVRIQGAVATVFSGNAIERLSKRAGPFVDARGSFSAIAGVSYAIQVASLPSSAGAFKIQSGMFGAFFSKAAVDGQNRVSFSLVAPPQQSYALDFSSSLNDWKSVGTGVVPDDGVILIQPYVGAPISRGYYRIRLP